MHFVTGGAFNGKRAWVTSKLKGADYLWFSSYEDIQMPETELFTKDIVVVEGIEQWTKELIDLEKPRNFWNEKLQTWHQWEKENSARQIIMIGIDISKGIVPIEKENRVWRDLTGWVYQDTVAICQKVDVIWYGINQTIKGETK